jgi:hypothetical protein
VADGDQARQAFAYGRVAQSHFIGLPGNPVSSFVTFLMLVRPFLLRLQGVQDVRRAVALPAHFAGAGPTGAASSCACGATAGRPGPVPAPGLGRADLGGLGRWPGRQPARAHHRRATGGLVSFTELLS